MLRTGAGNILFVEVMMLVLAGLMVSGVPRSAEVGSGRGDDHAPALVGHHEVDRDEQCPIVHNWADYRGGWTGDPGQATSISTHMQLEQHWQPGQKTECHTIFFWHRTSSEGFGLKNYHCFLAEVDHSLIPVWAKDRKFWVSQSHFSFFSEMALPLPKTKI